MREALSCHELQFDPLAFSEEALAAKVLAPFYRLERSRNEDTGGVGLGLSVARSIAKEHGGDVKLLNQIPTGLLALLEFPVS